MSLKSRLVAVASAVVVITGLGVPAFAVHPAPRPNPPSAATNVVGDATGDGKADIWATVSNTRWSLGNPRRGVTEFYKTNGARSYMSYVGDVMTTSSGNAIDKELATATSMMPTIDWNGDRRADFVVQMDGQLWLYYNLGDGHLKRGMQIGSSWSGMDIVIFGGDLNGDGVQYVIARQKGTGALFAYKALAGGRLTNVGQVGRGWENFRFIISPGNMVGDAKADLMAIDDKGYMWCFVGRGGGNISNIGTCGRGWNNFTHAFVPGDVDGDGRWDLISVKKVTNPDPYGSPIGGNDAPEEDSGALYIYRNLGNAKWDAPHRIGHDFYIHDVIA